MGAGARGDGRVPVMSRVIHFEIPARDPERLAAFYRRLFGWEIKNWGGPVEYWLVNTGPESEPGIHGAIARRDPREGTINTVSVPSVDDALGQVAKLGGNVLRPKMPIPGVGYHALCEDPDGNVFGILEPDPSAKVNPGE